MAGRSVLARTWFEQAEADFAAARDSAAAGHNEWSCFQAQQAGEKALKAFLYAHGRTSIITHSLRRLLQECRAIDASFAALDEHGRRLDQFYIPTRYPNGIDEEIPPARYYDRTDAEQCLQSAQSILDHVRPFFGN